MQNQRKIRVLFCSILLSLSLFLNGCSSDYENTNVSAKKETTTDNLSGKQSGEQIGTSNTGTFDISQIPSYSGSPYVVVNNNQPFFSESDLTTEAFESYSDLDDIGRCGVAYANVCRETMPTEKRGKIGMIKPTGWHTVKYDNVDGKYLYNRCHLIGYQLTAENANEKNLITGTRYLNVDGMLPFENMVADYVKETDHHVLYRVTPIFLNSNLVASGVLMEGRSVEDDDILFCVYCYNVQPGIEINYESGDSSLATDTLTDSQVSSQAEQTYLINENTKKFHLPSCSSVQDMNSGNKREYTGTKQELLDEGYSACKNCNP